LDNLTPAAMERFFYRNSDADLRDKPEAKLWLAVLRQAMNDLSEPREYKEAGAFFRRGGQAAEIAERIGLDGAFVCESVAKSGLMDWRPPKREAPACA
jgi:hypothetical protein